MAEDAEDGYTKSNWELALCAQINFENAERMNSGLTRLPLYRMAKMQFDALVKRLETAED